MMTELCDNSGSSVIFSLTIHLRARRPTQLQEGALSIVVIWHGPLGSGEGRAKNPRQEYSTVQHSVSSVLVRIRAKIPGTVRMC